MENKEKFDTQENSENSQKNQTVIKKFSQKKVVSIILSVVILLTTFFAGYFSNRLFGNKNAILAQDLIKIMKNVGYIYDPVTGEEREITEKEVGDALVNAFLDQYSAYYTEEEYKEVTQKNKGNYGGVGIAFFDTKDLIIDQVIMNSPLDRMGLKAGDRLVSVTLDGQKTEFSTMFEANNFFNALELEKPFELTYERGEQEFSVTTKKENYERAYVYYYDDEYEYKFSAESGQMLKALQLPLESSDITDKYVAYIKLDSFYGNAFSQLWQALDFMKSRQKTRLILDLRDNGGGSMDVFIDIASLFIYNNGAKKSPVAYSKGKSGEEVYKTEKNRFCTFLNKMVILANENTASASECLIGAILHYGDLTEGVDSVIVEKNSLGVAKTYGKGIMQTTFRLLSGGAFKLTTAKISWPDRETSIHAKGITEQMGCTVSEKGQALYKALEKLS